MPVKILTQIGVFLLPYLTFFVLFFDYLRFINTEYLNGFFLDDGQLLALVLSIGGWSIVNKGKMRTVLFLNGLLCAYLYLNHHKHPFVHDEIFWSVTLLMVLTITFSILKVKGFIGDVKAYFFKKDLKLASKNLRKDIHLAYSSKEFYKSRAWDKARFIILQNTLEVCGICKNPAEVCLDKNNPMRKGWHVDHILPRSIFPELALSLWNLRRLCPQCNVPKSNQVTLHEVNDVYLNLKTDEDRREFKELVESNREYMRIIEEAKNIRIAQPKNTNKRIAV